MAINGAPDAARAFWSQTVRLPPGAYQWRLSVLLIFPVNPPTLDLTIDGVSERVHTVTENTWRQLVIPFEVSASGGTRDVLLKIQSLLVDDAGNDVARGGFNSAKGSEISRIDRNRRA